ncbi:Acetyltransferase (GNAT) family protein [Candidatus Tiddalikarchaeum anstoanum]|nr:Acetyltransferase (GNAT) family protein [Candidatus Tiddalikarchaeum anstoanum]
MTNDYLKNKKGNDFNSSKKSAVRNGEFTIEKLPAMNKSFPEIIVNSWINPLLYGDEGQRRIKTDYSYVWNYHQRTLIKINPELDLMFNTEYEYEREKYKQEFSMSPLIIIKKDGEVAGGAWLERPRLKSQEIHIFINPEHEGKGLGKELVKNIERLIEKETETIECRWPENYSRAKMFFQKLGSYTVNDNIAVKKIREGGKK